ncbi:MAG: hypothetical protein NZ570_06490 [Candidatus Caldarchaeum sp.]|nr:hypothetical protein [Candidatus Caldarchaeum sp.]MDW8360061.1 hypothetical protein [Candidatus Caldarchaeum sp.]
MSQIIYTELEAFPIRWPYLQLEPLDTTTTRTWTSDQTFNMTTASETYSTQDTGSPIEEAVFGSRRVGQVMVLRHTQHNYWTGVELVVRRVGSSGPLHIQIYSVRRSSADFLPHSFHEGWSWVGDVGDGVSTTTWRAETRNFPRTVRITGIRAETVSTSPDRWQIRTANTDGSPTSTVIASGTLVNGETTLSSPLELSPGLYSFVFYMSSGSGTIRCNQTRVPATEFGTSHSTWVSTNSGSTWSSAGRTNYTFRLAIRTLAYVEDSLLAEYELPSSSFPTTAAWTSIMLSGRAVYQSQPYMIVLSSPQSPDASNCYMIQRGGTYRGADWGGNAFDLSDSLHLLETSFFFDGSTTTCRPHDVLLRKTHIAYASADVYPTTYFIGPGSYTPRTSINIRASSGTVFARPVVETPILNPVAEKSTTSTTYTMLTWDTSGGVPEIQAPESKPIRFLVRGNGSYNQVSYEPRIYYDKNPVTPRDFGFTELYLMRVRAEASNTLVRVNDRTNLFFATSGDSVVIDPNFRSYISKIQVITGRATCDMLGVV